MSFLEIKSNAKINISLGVLGKLKSKLHRIESLISFIPYKLFRIFSVYARS